MCMPMFPTAEWLAHTPEERHKWFLDNGWKPASLADPAGHADLTFSLPPEIDWLAINREIAGT